MLKQKVRRIWKINYQIPVNNVKLESKFEYKFLRDKFLDLINEKFNLFDERYIPEDVRMILFEIFLISIKDYVRVNELNLQTLLNNCKRYIFLMGLESRHNEVIKKLTNMIDNINKEKSSVTPLETLFAELRNKLSNEFSLINNQIDKEKILIIVFSFSIMLNNLMDVIIEYDENGDSISKAAFVPELKCSSRQRQFLINLLSNLDDYLLLLEKEDKEKNQFFSCLKINFMLENSIFSSLIKSYTKVLFDEQNKTKITLEGELIFELFDKSCENNSELSMLYTLFYKLIEDEFEMDKLKKDSNFVDKISNNFKSKVKSIYNVINSKILNNTNEQTIKNKLDFDVVKFIPFDPINISTHIAICINGHFLEGDIENIWQDFTLDEKRMDYYFFQWLNNDSHYKDKNLLKDTFLFIKNFNKNLSIEEMRLKENKSLIKRNKEAAKAHGKLLAYIIASRSIFKFHSISLIGYSLGCEVIKQCILELNKIYDYNPFDINDILHNIIFIGGATKLDHNKFKYNELFKFVSGRIVNCYSEYDKVLAEMYSPDAIGLKPLIYNNDNQGRLLIKNYDLSYLKLDHGDYKRELNKILDKIILL